MKVALSSLVVQNSNPAGAARLSLPDAADMAKVQAQNFNLSLKA